MYCKRCGKNNNDDAKFCIICGEKLKDDEEEPLEKRLENAIDIKLEEFGPKKTIEFRDYTKIVRERNIYNIDIIKFSKPNYKEITIMCLFISCLISFFVGVILLSGKNNIGIPFLIIAIVLFFIDIILILTIKKDQSKDGVLILKTGKDSKGIVSKKEKIENKKGNLYYINFKYFVYNSSSGKTTLKETHQRISKEYYNLYNKGDIIGIKLAFLGVIEENEEMTNKLINKMSIKY